MVDSLLLSLVDGANRFVHRKKLTRDWATAEEVKEINLEASKNSRDAKSNGEE